MQTILNRLDQLEQENHKLLDEIHALRRELTESRSQEGAAQPAPEAPPLQERVDVVERRVEELAQTKVEASQRMPIALTGMLLFNAFDNSSFGGGPSQDPVVAGLTRAPAFAGASLEQTILGLRFNGPDLPGGGTVSGNVYMDFSAGYGNGYFHLRTATIDLGWKNTTLTFGQDKPIFSPREPDSLAQVAISPLTGAGNLWEWRPQIRLEQRFRLGENTGLRAQAGVYETMESDASVPTEYASTLENVRPAYEGRFNFWHGDDQRRFELAPGFHLSTTHVAGASVPSRLVSFDGLLKPSSFLQFTGAWFRGENVANVGGLQQGFTVLDQQVVIPVHSTGGWAQIALFPTQRLSFHFYGGQQRNRESDLFGSGIGRNFIYAGNIIYRLSTNVLMSFEASQVRTNYLNLGLRLNNHYDLAMAYLF